MTAEHCLMTGDVAHAAFKAWNVEIFEVRASECKPATPVRLIFEMPTDRLVITSSQTNWHWRVTPRAAGTALLKNDSSCKQTPPAQRQASESSPEGWACNSIPAERIHA